MSPEQSTSGPARATRVFISYSRKDELFVRRLATSLAARGFDADWDQATDDPGGVSMGISAEDEWWVRLQQMIAAADVVVLVVSPDSATSSVCDEEIAYARALGKRVIAILCRPVDFRSAPPRLAALNVKLSFVPEAAPYERSLDELAAALDLDVEWLRESTRLTQAATRWVAAGHDDGAAARDDRLLQGDEVLSALRWAARRPDTAPPIAGSVMDFIQASQRLEDERRAVNESQRARYQEMERVARPLLEEELRVLESLRSTGHGGVDEEVAVQDRIDPVTPGPARSLASRGCAPHGQRRSEGRLRRVLQVPLLRPSGEGLPRHVRRRALAVPRGWVPADPRPDSVHTAEAGESVLVRTCRRLPQAGGSGRMIARRKARAGCP